MTRSPPKARPNCLEASGLPPDVAYVLRALGRYAICCRNECEELQGQLESRLQGAVAEPKEVLAMVSSMASDTVAAPRELSEQLRNRLQEVAEMHGGRVPIHGRLFAQWMHHAFPREPLGKRGSRAEIRGV